MSKKSIMILIAGAMSLTLLAGCGESKTATTSATTAPKATTAATAAATAAANSAASGSSSASNSTETVDLTFTLQNLTGSEIHGIYASESTKDDWEENLLPSGYVFPSGNEVKISFPEGQVYETSMFDIKAEDENGDSIYFKNIDLSKVSVVTLTIENGSPVATVQ